MKRRFNKTSKVNKGAPSGFIISLIVHAVAFFLAGLFVVFTVMPKEPPAFVAPPPVERPKMKLKKPKVKVRKSSTPKPSSRIVAKVKSATMPEIMLPDLIGTGEGLLGGTGLGGDFLDMPDLGQMTVFGGGTTIGNDMQVTFYTLARNKDGSKNSNVSHEAYFDYMREFVDSGWNKSKLSRFYRSPKKLYATTIIVPHTSSAVGPASFGESMDYGYCWVALFEGKLVHKEDITFRFWGASDDVLTVAVDNEVVLAANFEWTGVNAYTIAQKWVSKAPNNRRFRFANSKLVGGDWITLKAGVPRDLKAIAGEGPGGEFNCGLLVEVKDEKYPLNKQGAPIYPIFAMEQPTWEVMDAILENLFENEANVTDVTTIFKDY